MLVVAHTYAAEFLGPLAKESRVFCVAHAPGRLPVVATWRPDIGEEVKRHITGIERYTGEMILRVFLKKISARYAGQNKSKETH